MDWKRIAGLQFWLLFIPPIGWWKLWKDPVFNRTTKIRILFYTYIIPLILYLALLVHIYNATDRALQAAGGGF